MSDYFYLPWVRSGAASIIATADDPAANLANRATLTAGVRINRKPGAPDITRTLLLYGPGDVTGFDPRQVIRTEPVHLATDFEPNYFATVEFDRPDFPWLFTPASAGSHSRLRPWLCLVVVRKQEGVALKKYEPGSPLPVLSINSPADPTAELPDLGESWAWAHAQISGGLEGEPLASVLQNRPERTLSRLICSRKLTPREGYYACVVPAFKAGVQAGLGLAVDEGKLEPAWDLSAVSTPFKLPVYYSWEFMAGGAGDFESLVWLMQRKPPPVGVGQRPLAVQVPADQWPVTGPVSLQGALRPIPPDPAHPAAVAGTGGDFQEKLIELLNQGLGTRGWTLPTGMPVPPPVYGNWHAAQTSIPDATQPTGPANRAWLRTLNLEVRNRAAAGLGAAVVQENQEHLMASAWEQVGEIEKANQLLRQAQFAREASYQIYQQHLMQLPAEELAGIAGQALSRVLWTGESSTAYAKVGASKLPSAALQGAFRRLTRPRGPLAKRLGANNKALTGRLVKKLADGSIRPVPPHPKPDGMLFDDRFDDDRFDLKDKSLNPNNYPVPEALCSLTPAMLRDDRFIRADRQNNIPAAYRLFRDAVMAVQAGMPPCGANLEPPDPPLLSLADLKSTLEVGLDPRQTVAKRVLARLRLPPGWQPADALEPIMAAPVFPQAMYRELVKLSQDFLLPGVEKVLPNTITLLETNTEFVEAFMVGLNYEMGRELLWRGYPTDQRGSYFRQFWDPAGRLQQPATPEELLDIKPINRWAGNSPLGGNSMTQSAGSLAVLLIRGDLLRRYPRAMIYALKAQWEQDANGRKVRRPVPIGNGPLPGDASYPEQYPIFQGALPPDITFLGFSLASTALVGDDTDAGYFFVLQQQPTEPRYGLDETQQPGAASWDDLSWEDVSTSQGGYIRLSDGLGGWPVRTTDPFSQPQNPPDPNVFWFDNANSAHMASITMQKPLRVMIHASDLIGA